MAINKPFNVDDGTSISIDAKQRAIFTMKKRVTATEGGPIEWRVVCAEPSPDAITAISAASGATAETLKLALSGSFGSQESAASIGLRTQTIQILRDAMYRLCEGYASSALDEIAFARLQRRYQNLMLGLLAIEQLSGAVVARQAVLTGQADSAVSRSVKELIAAINQAKTIKSDTAKSLVEAATKRDETKKALNAAQKEYDDAKKASNNDEKAAAVQKVRSEKLDPSQIAFNAAESVVTHRKAEDDNASSSISSLERALSEAGKVSATALTRGSFEASAMATHISADTAKVIADAVQKIVLGIVDHDYSRETCIDTIFSRTMRVIDISNAPVALTYCGTLFHGESAQLLQAAQHITDVKQRNAVELRATALKAQGDSMLSIATQQFQAIASKSTVPLVPQAIGSAAKPPGAAAPAPQ